MTEKPEPKPTGPWKRWGYFLFLLVFTVTAVEVAGRWYLGHVMGKSTAKKFRFNSYRVYEHVPGYREGELADGTYRMTINSQGFRRRSEVAKEKLSDVYRIFLMGGSAAHGVSSARPFPIRHTSDTQTLDAVLERMLNERPTGMRVEVINAAVTGYQVFQHTAYLQSELLDYDPDLVIFFDGNNDHYTNNADMRYLDDYRFQFWKQRLQEPSFGGALSYISNWLAEYSGAFKAFVAWRLQRDAINKRDVVDITREFANDTGRIESHKRIAPKQFLRSMHMNLDLLEREGVDAILCLQPMFVLRDSTLWSEEEAALPWRDHNVQVLYPIVRKEVAEAAGEHHIRFIDMNPVLNADQLKGNQLFIDDCHLTPLGTARCAMALMPWITSLMEPVELPDSTALTAPVASGI